MMTMIFIAAVDASRAGEGQLEITVDNGAVPNTARPIDKEHFVVTFTPCEARPHIVQITFNGEQCKCVYNMFTSVIFFWLKLWLTFIQCFDDVGWMTP